jgi:N-formylglutamate deformylase
MVSLGARWAGDGAQKSETIVTDAIKAYEIRHPDDNSVPLVMDSPHSGKVFPADFGTCVSESELRIGEDVLIDELFPGPANGATMVAALFPRTYIDPNRSLEDLDPDLFDGEWPTPLYPGPKTAMGKGLIWSSGLGGAAFYDRKLTVAEVKHRIDAYWAPYRGAVKAELDRIHAQHGRVWHINCHSMPSLWPEGVEGAGTPVDADFIVGDRDGTTCGPEYTELVRDVLTGEGYRVAVNDRFKGVDIVAQSGKPAEQRHSLQIEVVRDRYMDETTFLPNDGFEKIRSALGTLVRAVADHASNQATS